MSPAPQKPIPAGGGPVAEFATALRALRDSVVLPDGGRLTNAQLAERAHVHPSTVSKALGGEKLPSASTVKALASACGADVATWEHRRAEAEAAHNTPPLSTQAAPEASELTAQASHTATAPAPGPDAEPLQRKTTGPPPDASVPRGLWRYRAAATALAGAAAITTVVLIATNVASTSDNAQPGTVRMGPSLTATTTSSVAPKPSMELRYKSGDQLVRVHNGDRPGVIVHAALVAPRGWPPVPPTSLSFPTTRRGVGMDGVSDYWELDSERRHTSTTFVASAPANPSTPFAVSGQLAFNSNGSCGNITLTATIGGRSISESGRLQYETLYLPGSLPTITDESTLTIELALSEPKARCAAAVEWQLPKLVPVG
ncbi:helix-turn-helix domain-containing protein [Amycolatopsis sp. cmx-4-61]|uniref:helix-turn-helix domain-containing protein n=1 Tax=Amycolatopsis sp. cmx-4-61 TaxID=2790937 RepID=UPI00397ADA93